MAPVPTVRASDNAASIAVGETLLVLWKGPANLQDWKEQIVDAAPSILETHPGGFFLMQIILPTSTQPTSASRKVASADIRAWGPKLRHMVTVPVGDSVRQAIVRTLIEGMIFLGGQRALHSVAHTPAAAIVVLRKRIGPSAPPVSALEEAIDKVYAALGLARERTPAAA